MLEQQLKETWSDVVVAYHRFHTLHLNIRGRTFSQDHKMLEFLYNQAFDEIDALGEIIRGERYFVPETINEIILTASLSDSTTGPTSDDFLSFALEAVEHLISSFNQLEITAITETYIQNHCQDQITKWNKSKWMLSSTLED